MTTYDHPIHGLMVIPADVHHSDPGTVDEYGDHPVAAVTTTTEMCWLWQTTRGETDEIEHERWSIAFKPTVALDANDSVTVQGGQFQVHGNPWLATDPLTGWHTHIEATLRRHI